jgi:hypothetical protein
LVFRLYAVLSLTVVPSPVPVQEKDLRWQTFVIPEGLPEIMVGASSRDIRLTWPLE